MGDLHTVKVKHGDDYAIINVSDFDPNTHEPFDEEAAKAVKDRLTDDHPLVVKAKEDAAQRLLDANRHVGAIDATSVNEANREAASLYGAQRKG
jgi:hypothetical protein